MSFCKSSRTWIPGNRENRVRGKTELEHLAALTAPMSFHKQKFIGCSGMLPLTPQREQACAAVRSP